MPHASIELKIYLARIDSDFSRKICEQYSLSQDSHNKLLARSLPLASQQVMVSRALVSFILDVDWSTSSSSYMLDDSITPPGIVPPGDLCLSLSHSGNYVAAVISTNRVAIDIEHVMRDRDYIELAGKAFHLNEVGIIKASASAKELQERFYKTWTLRECFYKLGILQILTDPEFDSECKLSETGYAHFTYASDDTYLAVISEKAMNVSFIHLN
jgi:4'-phosphopantetheinyl transferase